MIEDNRDKISKVWVWLAGYLAILGVLLKHVQLFIKSMRSSIAAFSPKVTRTFNLRNLFQGTKKVSTARAGIQ